MKLGEFKAVDPCRIEFQIVNRDGQRMHDSMVFSVPDDAGPVRVEIHSLDDPPVYDDSNYPHSRAGKLTASYDGVDYHVVIDSREEALREGCQFIGRCVRPPVLAAIDAERIIEDIQCQDEWSIDAAEGALDPSSAEIADLEERIRQCVSRWLTDHKLWPEFSLVEDVVEFGREKGGEE